MPRIHRRLGLDEIKRKRLGLAATRKSRRERVDQLSRWAAECEMRESHGMALLLMPAPHKNFVENNKPVFGFGVFDDVFRQFVAHVDEPYEPYEPYP